ncbi:MAG: tRNA 2-thiocytidine biosynthesis protein TtcA [Lachnospiraceae bacterium]|nr:tRNA 2-thiocytidine biosynthesis protein TtcA [Lachnospiraceae bacterium]
MPKELTRIQRIERSIIKTYRDSLWQPFIDAVSRYELLSEGDRVAVCISGGKDSMLMAKLMQEVARHGKVAFENVFLVMDPGYNEENRARILENASILEIPLTVLPSNIFSVAYSQEWGSPCYLCAKMRRGFLYSHAKELGCNKIALGHHFDDVIETTVMSMFYSSQLRAMLPKLRSDNFEGMELIRPLYKIHEKDIIRWCNYNDLHFIRCACRFTENIENSEDGIGASKRREIKELIRRLKKETPDLDQSIFNSIHSVCLDTMPGWKTGGVRHSFLENY